MVDAVDVAVRPDVVIAGRPEWMLLQLYSRIELFAAGARGVGIRGGRRPWLGLRMMGWFQS